MKKISFFPPLSHTCWSWTLLLLSMISTVLHALFVIPLPGAKELSQNLLREERLWGEILYQSEYLLPLLLLLFLIVPIVQKRNFRDGIPLIVLTLLWIQIKSKLLIPGAYTETPATMVPPVSDENALYLLRLSIANVALIPFLLWHLIDKKSPMQSVLNRFSLLSFVATVVVVLLMGTTRSIDLSQLILPLGSLPLLPTALLGVSAFLFRNWRARESA